MMMMMMMMMMITNKQANLNKSTIVEHEQQ